MNSPDLLTLKTEIDGTITSIDNFKAQTHAHIKIQSLLNIVIYARASRFLEASVKHIIYNLSIIKGSDENELKEIISKLKGHNNPEYSNIVQIFKDILNYDIATGKSIGAYADRDISFLNEIVRNRHRNVHASEDSTSWYNANQKDLNDFKREYEGILNIIKYLDSIRWDDQTARFVP
ncbi:hypothetical protein JWG45_03595 [Leptospira sp. 201903070]|uniref:RiboL-PSP-HEPN domain-containing protein n=1 Tax=Leptospira ainlahdjerensis TaxID=2810033 RepID=A0ABS2UBB9_9LEPT|nr:hypothetical protein [Leptospira ainlahdjerensis]MBM9576230.1 hypothetical protein [Leptospira ainlahdjerensis]